MKKNKNKILVTGGAGFIGSNFISYHINNTENLILNLDKMTYAGCQLSLESFAKNPNYTFVKGDICNKKLVEEVLKKFKPDYIVNFAAESHVDRSIENPMSFIKTNVEGITNLLLCSMNYFDGLNTLLQNKFKFLHISTDEVYGSLDLNDAPFKESDKYDPSSPYSSSKASSDLIAKSWFKTYRFPVFITNCSNNFGPFQFPEKLIPLVITNCIKRKPIPIYGKGINVRDWIFVEDHCLAINKVLLHGKIGQTYNIGADCEKNNLEIVNTICSKMDKIYNNNNNKSFKKLIKFVDDRPGHDLRYAINSSKIKNDLNWLPEYDFDSALDKTINWYVENEEWWINKIK